MTQPTAPEPAERPGQGVLDGHHPGLDGVRALSIAFVLAYHGDVRWARGGFLGISTFFALSGFLVATVLLRSDREGGIRATAFWARRVRRLFPAAMAGLALVGIYAATAASSQQVADLPGQALAAAANVANWKFIADGTSYAARFEAPSPVLHYWSLSVEEQFYLLAPLALGAVLGARRWRRHLPLVTASAAVAAVAWGAWLHHRGVALDRLYYGTDVRAAEILVGVAAAVALDRAGRGWIQERRRALGLVGAGALVALVALVATTELADPFLWDGGLALCAALTVATVVGALGGWGPLVLLGRGPLPALGRISYGVYLYHFPIFLWLTTDRVGVGEPALLALRVAVTVAVATVSYHYLEMPVRRGWTPALPRRWVPAAIPAVALGAVAVVTLGVASNDAEPEVVLGPGDAALEAPPTVPVGAAGDDGVLDVLAIGDSLGAEVLAGAAAELDGDERVRFVDGPAFACGGPADGPSGTVCRSWLDEWVPAVEATDPDVVVLHLADWTPDAIAADLGLDDADGVREVLDAGIDLLVAGGATVLWTPPGRVDLGIVLQAQPFYPAMGELLVSRPDLRLLEGMPPFTGDRAAYVPGAAAHLAEHLAHQARQAGGGVRIMLVGDSQVAAIGVGLQSWGESTGEATVWSAALQGCPLLGDGDLRLPGGQPAEQGPECGPGQAGWPEAAARFEPDLIVVMAALDDLADRRLPGTDTYVVPGDATFDAAALAGFTDLVDRLSAEGTPVAWLTAPCVRAIPVFPGADPQFDDDPARPAALNRVAEQLQAARPDVVQLVDVAERLCPGGEFLVEVDGVGDLRRDGVHLGAESSAWLAEQLGPELVALAEP